MNKLKKVTCLLVVLFCSSPVPAVLTLDDMINITSPAPAVLTLDDMINITLKLGLYTHVIVHTILSPSPVSPVIPWIELGGKPKWLRLNFGYHDIVRTAPIDSKPSSPQRSPSCWHLFAIVRVMTIKYKIKYSAWACPNGGGLDNSACEKDWHSLPSSATFISAWHAFIRDNFISHRLQDRSSSN